MNCMSRGICVKKMDLGCSLYGQQGLQIDLSDRLSIIWTGGKKNNNIKNISMIKKIGKNFIS